MTFSSVHHLTYGCAYDVHLCGGKPIAPSEVTWSARGTYITFYMRKLIVNTVKPSWAAYCTAVYTRLLYKDKHFFRSHIARINSLVSFAEEYSASFVGLTVFLITGFCVSLLFVGHIRPALFTAVTTFLTFTMTLFALVGQTKRSSAFSMEVFRRRGKCYVAAEACAGRHKTHIYGPHSVDKEK